MYASFDVEWLTRAAICRVVSHSAGSLLSTAFSRADVGAIRITVTRRLMLQLPPVAIRPFLWCGKWIRSGNTDANRYNTKRRNVQPGPYDLVDCPKGWCTDADAKINKDQRQNHLE